MAGHFLGRCHSEIATRLKKTRDETFIEKDARGHTVNRLGILGLDRRPARHHGVQLSGCEIHASPWCRAPGKPGQSLTRPPRSKFVDSTFGRGL